MYNSSFCATSSIWMAQYLTSHFRDTFLDMTCFLISFDAHVLWQGEASISCSQLENGSINSYSLFSEKALDELLQPPVQGTDEHLIEFSEAMRSMFMFNPLRYLNFQ